MPTFVTILSIVLIIALFGSPVLVLLGLKKANVKKYTFILYLIFGVIVTVTITFIFAWWSDFSDRIMLSHYGYDFEGMDETESLAKVSADNLEKVKRLKMSLTGIGWPVIAVITFVIYSPFILIVYLSAYLVRKIRAESNV